MLHVLFELWMVILSVILLIGHISFWCKIYNNGFGIFIFAILIPLFPIFGITYYIMELREELKKE